MDIDFMERIHIDPDILLGKPVIKGTRISVGFLLNALTTMSIQDIMEAYPFLSKDDIIAALYYAASIVNEPKRKKRGKGIHREVLAQ